LAIAQSFGSAFPLDERLMPAFIGISGSGIAYIYQFIHAMAEGGCLEGIPYPQSHAICYATMESAVALALGKEGTVAPMELEMKVCSAGGTTIEGVKALEEGGLNGTVIEAVAKTAEKSRKMEDAAKGK
jgi:pyrroline-5-carboxylate reductase